MIALPHAGRGFYSSPAITAATGSREIVPGFTGGGMPGPFAQFFHPFAGEEVELEQMDDPVLVDVG